MPELLRKFDAPERTLVEVSGRYIVAPWEKGGPVVSKRTYWAVTKDGVGLRIPRWIYRWLTGV